MITNIRRQCSVPTHNTRFRFTSQTLTTNRYISPVPLFDMRCLYVPKPEPRNGYRPNSSRDSEPSQRRVVRPNLPRSTREELPSDWTATEGRNLSELHTRSQHTPLTDVWVRTNWIPDGKYVVSR